ncbi:MAG: carbohydrate binding domain-containing protein, partial [Proteobacteria bacterium]|nr:carbohydrate binding domain-containing protein [Pseudomonadota bacterium]
VFVPQATEPGVYSGTIYFEPDNAMKSSIPLEINVLPFTLLDPPIVRFMWGPPTSIHPENETKIYQDMATHGLTTMILMGDVKTRDEKIGKEDIDNISQSIDKGLNTYNKTGFRDTPIGGIHNNQIIYYWDKSLKWFRYWPITPELDDQFVTAYREVFTQSEQAEKRSKLLHYLVDEPGGANPKNLEPAMHYLKLFKEKFPKLKTFVTIGGGMKQGYDEIGMLSPYLDVTCTNYVTSEVIDRLEKLHSEFWIYNGASLNVDPVKERFFFGWFAWKIGAKGVGQWTYAWSYSPFSSAFRDERQDYALETKDGYLPTVGLEMIREGIDDYRSLYTLAKLIQNGLQSKDQELVQKASKANLRLAELRKKVNLNYLRGYDMPESSVVGISADDLDSYRGELEQLIAGLLIDENETTWKTFQEKLKSDPEILFGKPSEKEWQQLGSSQIFGKDLLEETSFGGVLSDWKIQVWKGKGEGSFENGIVHQGNKSAKIAITSDNKTDNGVLVLHQPKVDLKKGTKYRLSSWIKTENVENNALLFAAVRCGGVSDVSSAKVKGNSDWKYVWLEFTPDEDCKAQYFSIRLWGQGTVYADRIVLQDH